MFQNENSKQRKHQLTFDEFSPVEIGFCKFEISIIKQNNPKWNGQRSNS